MSRTWAGKSERRRAGHEERSAQITSGGPKNATVVLIASSTENENPSKRKLNAERKQKLGDKNYLDQTLDIK